MSPSCGLYLGNNSSVHDYLKRLDVTLVAANSPDVEDAPRLVRRVLSSVAQFEKVSLVAKLKAARDNNAAMNGNMVNLNRSRSVTTLRRRLGRRRRRLREVATELAPGVSELEWRSSERGSEDAESQWNAVLQGAAMKCTQGSSAYLGLHRYTKVHGPKQGNPVAPLRPTQRRLRMRRKSNPRKPKWGFKLDHSHQRRLEIRCLCHASIVTHLLAETGVPWCQSWSPARPPKITAIKRLKLTKRAATYNPSVGKGCSSAPVFGVTLAFLKGFQQARSPVCVCTAPHSKRSLVELKALVIESAPPS